MKNSTKIIKNSTNLLKTEYIFLFFILCLTLINYLFCYLYVSPNYSPHLIDNENNYILKNISFGFGQIIEDLTNGNSPSLNWFGFELQSSRRLFLPYFLMITNDYVTSNFYLIHLIKNLMFGTLLFLTIKKFNQKYNNFFLTLCLFITFYIPHNTLTNLGTENEEGILNYLMIILFFVLISNLNFKSVIISIILVIIFLLKGSMFFMTLLLPFLYFFLEKNVKLKYLPIIAVILINFFWGINSFQKNGFFAFGAKGSSMNAINISLVTHKYFNTTYPEIKPDIHLGRVTEIVKDNKINNEKDLVDILIKKSIIYIIENPKEYFIGVLKKIYVLNFSPFKDAQTPKDSEKYLDNMYKGKLELNEKINNPIRLSNIPNKIIFNVSLILLLISLINFKKNSKYLNKLNLYYLSTLAFYLAPYMFAWIYPRHATSFYMIAHFYIMLYLIEKKIFSFNKIFLKTN